MNIMFSVPTEFKANLLSAAMDFDAPDTFALRLLRPGFSFNATNYQTLANIKATTGSISYTVTALTKTISRATGSFITDGFVTGNYITANGTNVGTYKVGSVTALAMTVSLVGSATLVDETATTKTITCQDEMAAITTGAIDYTVTATTLTFARSTGSFVTDGFVAGQYITTNGTNTGKYQVETVAALSMTVSLVGNATIVDESATGKIITNGYTRADVPVTFTMSGSTVVLDTDSFDWSTFGAALFVSGGAIIYDDTATGDPIVAYVRLTPWTLTF